MKTSRRQIIEFYKYHGAGNDFIMIDNRNQVLTFGPQLVRFLCDRHMGIGADGLIRIEPTQDADFRMIYHNADGFEGSMCGNGGRSAAAFALERSIVQNHCRFLAFDGIHEAWVDNKNDGFFEVRLSMADVETYIKLDEDLIINTGSPHYVKRVAEVSDIDVQMQGSLIRFNKNISEHGVNVNFVQSKGSTLKVRTYERGVEAETLSCGTGVTAAAIANKLWTGADYSEIHTKGGILHVELMQSGNKFTHIFLRGPVQRVFQGTIEINCTE